MSPALPAGLVVIERGWLSSNNIVCIGQDATALIDSGYCSHADQTLRLVQSVLGQRPLSLLVNTHLHSDHCGGNAAMQRQFPRLRTLIPPGQADMVRDWHDYAAEVRSIGQDCPRFVFDDVLLPGSGIELGDLIWQVHASPGHDPHSLILFEPVSATVVSADALWENGFGVVFSQLEGDEGFDEVAATLDLIESLAPQQVIPGHGRVFSDVARSIAAARRRLDSFVRDPLKHAMHAAKVLVKFKLLDVQAIEQARLVEWVSGSHFVERLHARYFSGIELQIWIKLIVDDLVRSGAARLAGSRVLNA